MDNFYFNITKLSRNKNNILSYIFIGTQNNTIKSILNNIENKIKLSTKDKLLLNEVFGENNIESWVKSKYNIQFIYDIIQQNDNIKIIKNKIFYYLSTKNKYVTQNNQLLWIKNKNTFQYLGYYYNNYIPPLYEKIGVDEIFIENRPVINNNNNYLINDILNHFYNNNLSLFNNTIYLYDAYDEYLFFKDKKKKMTPELYKGYFKKYFPLYNFEFNSSELNNYSKLLKNNIEKELYIYNLIHNYEVNPDTFSNTYITDANFIINHEQILDDRENINLYQLFDIIIKNLDYDMPFVKYNDNDLEYPISVLNTDVITTINEDILKKWLGIKKNQFALYNYNKVLSFKRLIGNYSDKPVFSTIEIPLMNTYKNTKINVKCNFSKSDKSTLNNLKDVVQNLSSLLSKINNDSNKFNIDLPSMEYINNQFIISNNIKFKYLNTIIEYNIDKKINFNIFKNISKYFNEYIDVIETDDKSLFKCKYKKISNYISIEDVFHTITKFKKENKDEIFILKELQKTYDININFSKELYIKWQQYSLKENMESFGINCIITDKLIKIDGVSNINQLKNVYRFFIVFIHIYNNYGDLEKNKNFQKYILDIKNVVNIDESKFELDEGEFNFDEEDLNNSELEFFNNMNNEDNNIDLMENIDIKPTFTPKKVEEDIIIEPKIKASCKDSKYIEYSDTCEDLCLDNNKYFLRRLQTYDNKLFHYKVSDISKKKDNIKQYSRYCQGSKYPVVLKYNPYENKKIDPKTFSYSYQYGSSSDKNNWYICPKVWCPYCELPIDYDLVKDNIRNKFNDKGSIVCSVSLCPYDNEHEVFIRGDDIYPGFCPNVNPINGLCLPCCYITPQYEGTSAKRYNNCLGLETNKNKTRNDGKIYILKKRGKIDENRYGTLPVNVSKILGSKCDMQYLENSSCFLRVGIQQNFYSSFLNAISYYLDIDNIQQLRKQIVSKIDYTLFKSLNDGNIEYKFFDKENNINSLENFKKYILESESINYEYLWDLLQRKNIIYPNGINIVIFSEDNVLCPFNNDIQYFYDNTKNTIILNKNKNHFEPIVFIKAYNYISIQKEFNSNIKQIQYIFDIIQNNCVEKYAIDWNNYLLSKNNNAFVTNLQQPSLNTLLKDFKPKIQIVDAINKVVFIQLDDDTLLPTKPSQLNTKYVYSDIYNNVKLNDYKYTYTQLNKISNKYDLPFKPIYKLLDKKKQIIGIVVENGRIIPIRVLPNIKSSLPVLPINYYSDVDFFLQNNIKLNDERINNVKKLNFDIENYERLRFELSKLINYGDYKSYKKDIQKIIDNKENINTKRELLYKLLDKLLKDKVLLGETTDYNISNIRYPCFMKNIKKKEDDDNFCVKDKKGVYKLFISKNNLINNFDNYTYYLNRLVEELLFNKSKNYDIINDLIPDVINKTIIDKNNNYIIFNENDPLVLINYIDNLFDKTHIIINPHSILPTSETKLVNFNYHKFIKDSNNIQSEHIKLNTKWSKLLNDDFNYYKYNYNTIFKNVFKDTDKEDFINNLDDYIQEIKVNILLLYHRTNKILKSDYLLIGPEYFDSDKYIILYINDNTYQSIYLAKKYNNYIFTLNILPKKLIKFIDSKKEENK